MLRKPLAIGGVYFRAFFSKFLSMNASTDAKSSDCDLGFFFSNMIYVVIVSCRDLKFSKTHGVNFVDELKAGCRVTS